MQANKQTSTEIDFPDQKKKEGTNKSINQINLFKKAIMNSFIESKMFKKAIMNSLIESKMWISAREQERKKQNTGRYTECVSVSLHILVGNLMHAVFMYGMQILINKIDEDALLIAMRSLGVPPVWGFGLLCHCY